MARRPARRRSSRRVLDAVAASWADGRGLARRARGGRGAALHVYLILDQFEEYFLYHGAGPLGDELPELLRRAGLRVNVLSRCARTRSPSSTPSRAGSPTFANPLRLERLDRAAARAAIVGPLGRYSELAGATYGASRSSSRRCSTRSPRGRSTSAGGAARCQREPDAIEAPYLQLVLERLWEPRRRRRVGRAAARDAARLGGAGIVRAHVGGRSSGCRPRADAAARLVRHLVTPSGTKISRTGRDLAEYAGVGQAELDPCSSGSAASASSAASTGRPAAPSATRSSTTCSPRPVLAWRDGHEVERERAARGGRQRLLAVVAAALAAL